MINKQANFGILSALRGLITDAYQKSHQKWVQQQEQQQKQIQLQQMQQQQIYMHNLMINLAQELFPAMKGKSYHYLCPIKSPEDIRIKDWRITNGYYLLFSLSKTTDIPYTPQELKHLTQDISMDLARHNTSLHNTSEESMWASFHPITFNGIKALRLENSPENNWEALLYISL
jgi:hypothetical protein